MVFGLHFLYSSFSNTAHFIYYQVTNILFYFTYLLFTPKNLYVARVWTADLPPVVGSNHSVTTPFATSFCSMKKFFATSSTYKYDNIPFCLTELLTKMFRNHFWFFCLIPHILLEGNNSINLVIKMQTAETILYKFYDCFLLLSAVFYMQVM